MKRLDDIPAGSTLGINYTCMHDAAIAIVDPDGRPVFACALERITRVKQDGRWPARLLEAVPMDRIETIAIGSLTMAGAHELGAAARHEAWPARRKDNGSDLAPFPYPSSWDELVSTLPGEPLRFDHHHSHAASAYFLTDMESSLVITCDAGAHQCPWHLAAYRAQGDSITPLAGMHFQQFMAPAHLYTLVTALLGLRPNRHEGKVTGLAARGQVSPEELVKFEELAWPLSEDVGKLVRWDLCDDVDNAPTVAVNESVRRRWRAQFDAFTDAQLAACAQRVLEDYILDVVRHTREVGVQPFTNICLAGGVFANVLLNQKVIAEFDRGFVAPPMTDDGVALGAALLGHVATHPESSPRRHRSTMYLGPDIDEPAPRLDELELQYERPDNLARTVAGHLNDGKIVAVARGRMEFGPRALGHRSVLAPAIDPAINDSLNHRLQRTEYMPFAPMIHVDHAEELVEGLSRVSDAARFMTVTTDCRDALKQEAPAIVHVDGTARPQIVDPVDEPFCAKVLEEYAKLSGRRAIVNTSFNVHEQPIVCTIDDAITGFAQTELDYLCLGDVVIPFVGNEGPLRLFAADATTRRDNAGNLSSAEALGRWIDQAMATNEHLAGREQYLGSELEAACARATDLDGTLQEVRAEAHEVWQQSESERHRLEAELQDLRDQLGESTAALETSRLQNEETTAANRALRDELTSVRHRLDTLGSSRWVRLGEKLRILKKPGS